MTTWCLCHSSSSPIIRLHKWNLSDCITLATTYNSLKSQVRESSRKYTTSKEENNPQAQIDESYYTLLAVWKQIHSCSAQNEQHTTNGASSTPSSKTVISAGYFNQHSNKVQTMEHSQKPDNHSIKVTLSFSRKCASVFRHISTSSSRDWGTGMIYTHIKVTTTGTILLQLNIKLFI